MKPLVALLAVSIAACSSSPLAGGDASADVASNDVPARDDASNDVASRDVAAGAGGGAGGLDAGSDVAVTGPAGAAGGSVGSADAASDVPADIRSDAASEAGADAQGGASAGATIVPLYTYPSDPSWAAIVTAHAAHPTVRVVAIVNPDSGPGAAKLGAFTTGIGKLVATGIDVIGYVATGYAGKSTASVEAEIDAWRSFYPQVGGIFFDEQSDDAADVAYYRALSQYAKAHGLAYTVGNPGTDTAEAYVGALDTMLIYESKGLPGVGKLGGWHARYAPSNFGVIPYGAAFDAAFVRDARRFVGFVYLQNDDLPNPWDTLPPFFGDLLAALE
ncbi:MAG TPA: spherulation-specific family 4 protein [Polyangia bacterium]|nr:spherulation-specific family 4 protein [Polyangia bacterium]